MPVIPRPIPVLALLPVPTDDVLVVPVKVPPPVPVVVVPPMPVDPPLAASLPGEPANWLLPKLETLFPVREPAPDVCPEDEINDAEVIGRTSVAA